MIEKLKEACYTQANAFLTKILRQTLPVFKSQSGLAHLIKIVNQALVWFNLKVLPKVI